MGLGAATLALAALAVMAWLWYLVAQSRVRHRREKPPENLSPFMTDDELENRRLDRVLIAALIWTAILAVVLPIYYLNEGERQERAQHRFDDIAVERGHELWLEFQCGNCHGADGGGGGAPYVEPRTGIPTTWKAPSLNDVLYRYNREEVRFWLVFGRPGTPMPAWGTDGGGPLNSQQIDELIAYIEYIQIGQSEVVSGEDGRLALEVSRLAGADDQMATAITAQEDEIAALMAVPSQYEAVKPMPAELEAILVGPATCSDQSAAALKTSCDGDAPDSDRDGISDAAETALNDLITRIVAAAPPSDARGKIEALTFDPQNPFTTSVGATPVPDAELLEPLVSELEAIERDLRLTTEGIDGFLETAEAGLASLLEAQEARRWYFDVEAIASEAFEGNITRAQRAVALYNAHCARCHTAGYSAGIPFTEEAGSGALGPSLRQGRAVVQFPDIEDHYNFLVTGSDNGKQYGVSGIGRGWMPGFGAVLSQDDIMLIAELERALE